MRKLTQLDLGLDLEFKKVIFYEDIREMWRF